MNKKRCEKCNYLNPPEMRFCQICGTAANAQNVSNSPPQFQVQNQAQFPPQQPAQMPPQQYFQPLPQYAQPQTPHVALQKPDGTHNLMVVGLVFGIFAVAIVSIIWIAVFGAPGAKKIIPILIFSAGLLMTVINTALAVRKMGRIKKFTKTTGLVMNVETRQGGRHFDSSPRNTLFTPTVRFQTADGRIVDYTPKIASSWNNYQVGENVPVYYDPQQPENPTVGNPKNLWFPYILFGLVGGGFLLGGAIAMLVIFF